MITINQYIVFRAINANVKSPRPHLYFQRPKEFWAGPFRKYILFMFLTGVISGCTAKNKEGETSIINNKHVNNKTTDNTINGVVPAESEKTAINKTHGKLIGHANSELPLQDKTAEDIKAVYGEPTEVKRNNFIKLAYEYPNPVTDFDEQWIYSDSMIHTVIFMKNHKVLIAIQEWSDF